MAGVAEVAKEAVEEYKSTEQPAIDATVAATTPEDGQTVAAAAEEGATDAVTVQLEGSAGAAIQSNAETSMEQQQSAEAAHTSVNGNNNKSSSSEENRHQGGGGDDADTASSSVLRQPHGVLLGKIILDTDVSAHFCLTPTLSPIPIAATANTHADVHRHTADRPTAAEQARVALVLNLF